MEKYEVMTDDYSRSRGLELIRVGRRVGRGGHNRARWRARGGGHRWRRLVDSRVVDLRVTHHAHEERTLVRKSSLVATCALLVQVLEHSTSMHFRMLSHR